MSAGHYHRRWSSGQAGRTTPTSFSTLSSAIEPSTYGTSWNSVRWNKPTPGYRSQSSSIALRFEKPSTYSSPSPARSSTSRFRNYASDAVKTAADLASLGPSVSTRASRFDATVRDTKEKYRNEARELINKWTSRERPTGYFSQHFEPHKLYAENSYSRKPFETTSSYLSKANDYPYRKTSSMTPTRSSVPTVARYSSLDRSSTGLLSPSPTPQLSTTPKFERPWRQRMAESAKIRAIHGDEVSASYAAERRRRETSRASSRRGSLSQASGDELGSCLDNLRSYLNASGYTSRDTSIYGPTSRFSTSYTSGYKRKEEEDKPNKYMSRSYSPIRSPHDLFKNTSSSVLQTSLEKPQIEHQRHSRPSSRESVRDDSKERHVSSIPKTSTIRESSRERELDRRRTRSSKERTARRNSRQRSQQLESSSEGEDMEVREETKRRRRRKKTEDNFALPPTSSASALAKATMVSSIYDTSKEETSCHPVLSPSAHPGGLTGASCLLVNGSEDDFQSCAGSLPSPGMGQKISRSNSSTRLPSKTQIIKSPSVVEVPGISRSSSKAGDGPLSPGPLSPPFSPSIPLSVAESTSLHLSNSLDHLDDLQYDSEEPTSSVQGDVSQYSAVAHFKPYKPKVKRIAPVPGLWNSQGDEQVISKNKTLVKDEEHMSTFKIWNIKPREKVSKKVKAPVKKKTKEPETVKKEQKITQDSPIKKLFLGKKKTVKPEEVKEQPKSVPPKEKEKPKPPKEETVSISATFTSKAPIKMTSSTTIKDKRRVDLPPKKLKAIKKTVEVKADGVFQKKAVSLKAQKTLASKVKNKTNHKLKCRASGNASTQMAKELKGKEPNRGAQVIVDRPQKGVNAARVKLRCRQPEKRISLPSQSELAKSIEQLTVDLDKARLSALPEDPRRSMSRDSQSRAAELLDEMRYTEPALEWRRRDSGGQLILPDKSILEEYVRRKRGHLERLHSEPIRDDLSVTTCDSPCPSTTSELIPASAVRVHGASPREIPVITAPSRCSTIETPTPMLDSIQSVSFNNFNSTPQGFLRTNAAKLQCSRPIVFDTPKTPFEERLQQQANAIRRASHTSDLEMREPSPRRGSEAGQSISSAFTQAVADKAVQPRHERYAAHIPVNRGETSGRQSSASVDSTQSGALDQATKQLDQVIDQARHRHHQHRSKFKEAIDYLDQIFEDLKKECDVTGEDKNNNQEVPNATVTFTPKRPAPVHQLTSSQGQKSNSLPDRAQRHHRAVVPSAPSPVDVTIPKKKSIDLAPQEVAITETIVLPKKTDKLDFTRRWLHDDLSSLAQQPPGPVMFSENCAYGDVDEHSLGSCSAEVAAINANKKEKVKKSNSAAPVQHKNNQPAPIRPQPQRLQPTYAIAGSSNGTRHFPVEYDGLQRVASFDHVQMPRENSWRAGSQEPYQTLGSVRSDIDRPSPSAFQNVSAFNQRGGMRGSLRSLQNIDMLPPSKMTPPRDPALAIDALVAELELNTEQPTSAADKRRSFPTSLRAEPQERHVRRGSERHGSRGRNGYSKQASYQEPSFTASQPQHVRHNRQQRSLDEAANMLQHVVGDLGNMQRQRKPLQQQTSLNHNLLQNPFQTINQEKISPSRVEAMHNMFERGAASWRSPQPYQQPVPQPYKPPKDDECYYDLADYAVKAYKRVSPPRQVQTVRQSPLNSSQEFTPAYPTTQPPQHPPGRNGSANSSTNGGYYSSNSSTAGPSHAPAAHRSSLIGRQSLVSSRGPSVDDEDDGFYDNIGSFGLDERRYSRGSELDVASISSARPPTSGQKQNRIGSFLRKIGGSSRPPGSAASLISLNKVVQEAPIRSTNLMKSNSLSTEPWKKQVLQQSMPNQSNNKGGLGQRLKNSLFGSKKRLNG